MAFVRIDHVASGGASCIDGNARAVVQVDPVLDDFGGIHPGPLNVDAIAAVAEDGVATDGHKCGASYASGVVIEDHISFHPQGTAPNPDGFVIISAGDAVAADDAVAAAIDPVARVVVDVAVGDGQVGGGGEIDRVALVGEQFAAQHLHAITQVRTAAFDVNAVLAVHDLEGFEADMVHQGHEEGNLRGVAAVELGSGGVGAADEANL